VPTPSRPARQRATSSAPAPRPGTATARSGTGTGVVPATGAPAVRSGPATEALAATPLTDHHCHGVFRGPLDDLTIATSLTESDSVDPRAGSPWASRIGFALRRECAPLLDLEPHAPVTAYLARRAELGAAEVTRRMLAATGTGTFLVDTGLRPPDGLGGLTTPRELAAGAGPGPDGAPARAFEIVRLESVAERVAAAGTSAVGFPTAFREALDRAVTGTPTVPVVGVKSIAAYRAGLDLDGRRPSDLEVVAAAARWLRLTDHGERGPRLTSPTLHRFLIWEGIDRRLPVQLHTGIGDVDAHLHRADPVAATDLLRRTASAGVPLVLLHTYPFHRQAGHLAQVFPHVFTDVGLALHGVGDRAGAVLAEALELVPFGSFLYSSDAYGLPELHLLGALLFKRALSGLLDDGVVAGDWSESDAVATAVAIAAGNAGRVYDLRGGPAA